MSVISAVAEAGQKGDDLTKMFFKEEYALNYAIGELSELLKEACERVYLW